MLDLEIRKQRRKWYYHDDVRLKSDKSFVNPQKFDEIENSKKFEEYHFIVAWQLEEDE